MNLKVIELEGLVNIILFYFVFILFYFIFVFFVYFVFIFYLLKGNAPIKVQKKNTPQLLLAKKWDEKKQVKGYWASEKLEL